MSHVSARRWRRWWAASGALVIVDDGNDSNVTQRTLFRRRAMLPAFVGA
jgi:hypothetical protein